jgi:hypothetical protein
MPKGIMNKKFHKNNTNSIKKILKLIPQNSRQIRLATSKAT